MSANYTRSNGLGSSVSLRPSQTDERVIPALGDQILHRYFQERKQYSQKEPDIQQRYWIYQFYKRMNVDSHDANLNKLKFKHASNLIFDDTNFIVCLKVYCQRSICRRFNFFGWGSWEYE